MEYRPAQKPKKSKGGQELIIIIAVIGLSVTLSGGFYLRNIPGPPVRGPVSYSHGTYCCDSGSGLNCHPIVDSSHPTVTFNSPEDGPAVYGLLKSNITMSDCAKHIKDSGQKGPNNEPIIYDTSNEIAGIANEVCNTPWGNIPLNITTDTLADYRSGTKLCYPIPNDEIIYLCKANCHPATGSSANCDPFAHDYYGDGSTVYDVYFRLKDYNVPRIIPDKTPNGIPDVIQNCISPSPAWNPADNQLNPNAGNPSSTPSSALSPTAVQGILTPLPYPTHFSEQLHTFQFGWPPAAGGGPQQWVRPWCKPAIYLYPDKSESVRVRIAPKGNILNTIPAYPANGWDVLADPNGTIHYKNNTYPYLYYEAAMPDNLLTTSTNTGYVVSYNKLSGLFASLLPALGLNPTETKQFSDYWLKALPSSPYYKVTIVPRNLLDQISPLTINPAPQTTIRVSLNFQPLDKPDLIETPQISTISRKGFTVVEWGGLFKKDKNHPFTCLQ